MQMPDKPIDRDGSRLPERGTFSALYNTAVGLLLFCAVGAISFMLWETDTAPKQSRSFGIAKFSADNDTSRIITARTRVVHIPTGQHSGGRYQVVKQIQLPSGQWIDCRDNCSNAYKQSTLQ